ncbi:MAG: bifunctional NADH dehydrogenase FAD-containing subunit/selenide, water dikinase SelD, partial [Sulfitobacter sp.]
GVQAEIWRDKVPLYRGARALSDGGIRSSLLQDNIENAPTVGISDPLMHDPQTAGGLLAALPLEDALRAVATLQAQGQQACIIGQLAQGHGPIIIS